MRRIPTTRLRCDDPGRPLLRAVASSSASRPCWATHDPKRSDLAITFREGPGRISSPCHDYPEFDIVWPGDYPVRTWDSIVQGVVDNETFIRLCEAVGLLKARILDAEVNGHKNIEPPTVVVGNERFVFDRRPRGKKLYEFEIVGSWMDTLYSVQPFSFG